MTEYAYESIDDANADLNRLIDELKDARRANRALLAQLDEARTDAIKDREAFAAALVIEADRLRAALAEAERKLAVSEKLRAAASQSGNEVAKSTLDYYAMEKRKARTYEKLAASFAAIASRQRRTIRALVVAARAMDRTGGGELDGEYWYPTVRGVLYEMQQAEQAERGQADKDARHD